MSRIIMVVGLALFSLTACTPRTITQDRAIVVNTPVSQPCALERPAPVDTLHQRYPDEQWAAMDVRQKAAAVGKWALDQQAYGRRLDASTAGCE